MNQLEQKQAAQAFVERWQAAEGSEERESDNFWLEFLGEVLDVPNPTYVLDRQRKVQGRKIDIFYDDMGILIENKSRGVDLDKAYERGKNEGGEARMVTPYQQAKWYADNMPRSLSPRWLITCNFDQIRIYDLEEEDPPASMEEIRLEQIPDLIHRFSFFTRKEGSRLEREKELSVDAGIIVGRLFDELSKRYHDIENSEEEQRSLNILITRIVFLLYAEDAGLLQEHQAFFSYLKGFSVEGTASALKDLFEVLKTPEDERGGLYVNDKAKEFPYINGGLFADDILIPSFDADARFTLLQEASADFDWKDISPTIFGAVFESTLNPETRRAGGMHYTSVENIHKVTGPLFYEDLRSELAEIEGEKQAQKREFRLREFRDKLGKIKVLDPACGSGNFLTETYLGLRKLENRVLESLYGSDTVRLFQMEPILVTVDQFYGIEISDFAVEVAKTALWIAELQMLEQTREIMNMWIEPLPLKTNDNIHCANALRIDWNDVIPANECNFIIGNPPFVGSYRLDPEQQKDRSEMFGKEGGVLDYVACWYKKAAEYMGKDGIRSAFVSTNSICQGQQVEPLWRPLFANGIHIDFAWKTFVWNSEALDQAHVHVIIVGFSRAGNIAKRLFDGATETLASNINGYLADAPSVFVSKHAKPLSDVPEMAKGFQATDNGYLLMYKQERDELIGREPDAVRWIRPFSMGADFINGEERFCLWLVDASNSDIEALPLIKERVEACRSWRSMQTPKGDAYKLKDTPHLLRPCNKFHDATYIGVPKVSSGRREYVPFAFIDNGMIPGDKLYFVETDSLYHFGVMLSQFQNAWMRQVAGRLKSDYSYANTIVYNNFIWPNPSDAQKQHVEWCAQQVLDAREKHAGKSLADLYDPAKMPSDLKQAHHDLDMAVEVAYGVNFNGDEEKIVAHLFKLYAEAVGDCDAGLGSVGR